MELKSTIQQLKNEHGRVEKTLANLDHAISVLEGLAGGTHVSAPAAAHTGKRPPLSAAARKKISLAQKARWAKTNQQKQPPPAVAHKRPPLSAAARKKISLAQKARWAKVAQLKQPQPQAVAHKRPPLSAAARKKISLAQKARWAKQKQAQG
jgi:hypothetical protein